MANPRSYLDRRPLNELDLRSALVRTVGPHRASLWRELAVVTQTASTNEDLTAAAREGADEGIVLIAESQTAGRGRHDREWVCPPCAGLTFSVLLRPAAPRRHWGWLPLLAGVAVTRAIATEAVAPAVLKWPNDVLLAAPPRKVAGILVSVVPTSKPAVVLGIGLNVNTDSHELPGSDTTSLRLERAAPVDRSAVLIAVLGELASQYERWCDHDGDADSTGLRQMYRRHCHTLGKRVALRLPDRSRLVGQAMDVDATGRLVVATETGLIPVAAGDVISVR